VGRVKEVKLSSGDTVKVVPVPTTLWIYLACARERDRNGEFDYSHDFYAPILLHIPSADISNNEIFELRQHMSTWPDNVEPGTVSLLRGQDFALQSHIISKGTSVIKPQGAMWIGKFDGNDVSGYIYVKGTSIIDDRGLIAKLEFSKPFKSKPRVLLTAINPYASTIATYVKSSESGFSIYTTTTTSKKLGKDSEWNYFVIG
jgi:hypothetical protein